MGYTKDRTLEEYLFEELEFKIHILDKHFSPLADRDLKFVVIHHMTIIGIGDGSANDACYRVWLKRKASAHYCVDGEYILQTVWDKDFAWATGSNYGNLYGISIENANKTASPLWEIDIDTWMTSAKLSAYIHKAKNLGRPTSVGFGLSGTLRTHQSFYATACPGPFFKSIWTMFVIETQRIYDEITGVVPPVIEPPVETANTHVVEGGDTLWAISNKYNVSVEELAVWNKLQKPYILSIGTSLSVSTPKTHVVVGGDTLWAISKKYEVTVDDLAKWNSLPSPYILPIGLVLSLETIKTSPDPVDPNPPDLSPKWDHSENWIIGRSGPDVTYLGERVVLWSEYEGLENPYFVGPGENFGLADVRGTQKLQIKWGYGKKPEDLERGGNSDGYAGPSTFDKLKSDPPKKELVTKVSGLHWNIAGSDTKNGYKAENGTRGPAVGRYAKEIGFEVFVTCEASQSNLRAGMNTVLKKYNPWMKRAKGIWYDKSKVTSTSARKAYSDNTFAYLSTLKWGAGFFGVKDGKKFSILELHTDYRKPAKQSRQVQSIFRKFIKDSDKMGVPRENVVVAGDFNWDGSSGDNPFKALADWSFVEKGDTRQATFLTGKHLDGILGDRDSDITVTRPNRANSKGVRLSDHYPLKFIITLK